MSFLLHQKLEYQALIYRCLSCVVCSSSLLFLGFDGTTLAGVERSDWEKRIKICIRTVTIPKPNAENAMPFHEDKSEDH